MSTDSTNAPLQEAEAVAEAAPKKAPQAFSDLKKADLAKAAEFFGANPTSGVAEIRAELVELGVTWDMYAAEFLSDAPAETLDSFPTETFNATQPTAREVQKTVTQEIVTVPEFPTLEVEQKYLIKFVGENPYFERGKYKFTAEDPFAVMPAQDAQNALVEEPKKFRQAFPNELKEYYS